MTNTTYPGRSEIQRVIAEYLRRANQFGDNRGAGFIADF